MSDHQFLAACHDVDKRWAAVLRCDPELIRRPGTHYAAIDDPDAMAFMGFSVHFLALRPDHSPDTLVVGAPTHLLDAARERLANPTSDEELFATLLELGATLGCDDNYAFDMRLNEPASLNLAEPTDDVVEFAGGSEDLVDWDGKRPAQDVDGALFATFDDAGLTAWAGVKQVSPYAQDIQVATRPDMRRRGLARAVSSAAFRHIAAKGITPYYAHFQENTASAAVARSLGLRRWGRAVLAESRIPYAAR